MPLDKKLVFLAKLPVAEKSRIDRAILIVSFYKLFEGRSSLAISEILDLFQEAHLARPNHTELANKLKLDRRVSFRSGKATALHSADEYLQECIPDLFSMEVMPSDPEIDMGLLANAPFIESEYLSDLSDLVELYRALHVLENSIRRLIEAVLERKLGANWWSIAATTQMQGKHKERLEKEEKRKWLPSRSTIGPLYSIDWSDLISLIRKYEVDFLPFIGEINFMHRFADLGLLRHVIAHHGFVRDKSEFQRVQLALRDWNNQILPNMQREFPAR